MKELTQNQQDTLDYLEVKYPLWVSPTQIGHDVGGWNRHSTWASPICLGLVARGLLERNDKGWYRFIPEGGVE